MSPTCSERGAAVVGGDATLRCDSVSSGRAGAASGFTETAARATWCES